MAYVFTFGHGQFHPLSGAPLLGRYVTIPAASHEAAREEMVRRFRMRWCGQYASETEAGVETYRLVALTGDEALGVLAEVRA